MATDTNRVDIKRMLEAEMRKAKERNGLPIRGSFIADEELETIMTPENITARVHGRDVNPREYNDFDREDVARKIKDKGRKVYAVLILLEKSNLIASLMNHEPPINDPYLFQAPKAPGSVSRSCSRKILKTIPIICDIAEDFYQKQWVFTPKLRSRGIPEFDSQCFIFPFASQRAHLGHGYHGEVYGVDIPRKCLDEQKSSKTIPIAYKRIRHAYGRKDEWEKAKREVLVLQSRRAPNVTPLLASFVAGYEDATDADSESKCLYLISPRATMDMDQWLREEKPYIATWFPDEDDFQRHIVRDTMLGLISGLTHIHRVIDGKVGYHRDIKPSNLLLFHEHERKWVWKICDFGAANIKEADNTKTRNLTVSPMWAPPEFFTDSGSTNGETHGRAHDVFSMGCVFLCLMTILKRGWGTHLEAGTYLEQFQTLRMKHATDNENAGAFYNSPTVVQNWIEGLQEESDKEIFALIKEMMLPRETRVYAWEVEVDLYIHSTVHGETRVVPRLHKILEGFQDSSCRTKDDAYARAVRKSRSDAFLEELKKVLNPEVSQQVVKRTIPDTPPAVKVLSMFSSSVADQDLYKRQELLERIQDKFRTEDIVALYGIKGAGKTSVAAEYVKYVMHHHDTTSEAKKKHRIRMNANSVADVHKSYTDIAAELTACRNYQEAFKPEDVKPWLENKDNSGWFMLVDDLGSDPTATAIRKLLPDPRHGYDQILITTRDRKSVEDFHPSASIPCIKVELPSPDDALRVFSRYRHAEIPKGQEGAEGEERRKLAKALCFPDLIKDVTAYMKRKHVRTEEMNDLVAKLEPLDIFRNYLEGLLQPLLKSSRSLADIWESEDAVSDHREIFLLFNLAFFGHHGVEDGILRMDYKDIEHEKLINMRGRLLDCSFIREDRNSFGETVFVINGNIRMALINWVRNAKGEHGGLRGLLHRYDRALSMVYRYYVHQKNTPEGRDLIAEHGPHAIKERLMSHFGNFVDFVRSPGKPSAPLQINLDGTTVRLIIFFSHVLLDKDRYQEAMDVVEYATAHFGQDESNDDRRYQKILKIRLRLRRHLVKIYLSHPEGPISPTIWAKAEEVIKTSMEEAEEIKEVIWGPKWDPKRDKTTVSHWGLQLDLVRVKWKSKACRSARDALEEIKEKNGGGLVQASTGVNLPTSHPEIARWVEQRYEEDPGVFNQRRSRFRMFLIELAREDGLLHLAEGVEAEKDGRSADAQTSWPKAKKALDIALRATKLWFEHNPDYKDLMSDLEVEKAVADTKMGVGIAGTITVLEEKWKALVTRYGSCKRTWDMECKLNAARLKGEKRHIEEAIQSANRLLPLYEDYEKRFGGYHVDKGRCEQQIQSGSERLTWLAEEELKPGPVPSPDIRGDVEPKSGSMWTFILLPVVLVVVGLYMKIS